MTAGTVRITVSSPRPVMHNKQTLKLSIGRLPAGQINPGGTTCISTTHLLQITPKMQEEK